MFNHLKNRKLYRSPKDGLVFGICSGLAHYLQVDVVFVRLIFILGTIASGVWPLVVAYVVALILVPIDPAQESVETHQKPADVTQSTGETEFKPEEPEEKMAEEKMDANQNM